MIFYIFKDSCIIKQYSAVIISKNETALKNLWNTFPKKEHLYFLQFNR